MFQHQVGEKIGNPQSLTDTGEVMEEASNKPAPLGTVNSYNSGSKPVPTWPTNKMAGNGGYGQQEKSAIITHPIISLTPYQNKYVRVL